MPTQKKILETKLNVLKKEEFAADAGFIIGIIVFGLTSIIFFNALTIVILVIALPFLGIRVANLRSKRKELEAELELYDEEEKGYLDKCSDCGTTKSNKFWDFDDGAVLCNKCYNKEKEENQFRTVNSKNKAIALILAIFLYPFAAGYFYLGEKKRALIWLGILWSAMCLLVILHIFTTVHTEPILIFIGLGAIYTMYDCYRLAFPSEKVKPTQLRKYVKKKDNGHPIRMETSGYAIASIIVGIFAIIWFWIIPFLGLFLVIIPLTMGITALKQIKQGERRGEGLAITGITISVIAFLFGIVWLVVLSRNGIM